MYFQEFQGTRIAALACAVPDNHENLMDYAEHFSMGEVEKFCESTGIYFKYNSTGACIRGGV